MIQLTIINFVIWGLALLTIRFFVGRWNWDDFLNGDPDIVMPNVFGAFVIVGLSFMSITAAWPAVLTVCLVVWLYELLFKSSLALIVQNKIESYKLEQERLVLDKKSQIHKLKKELGI